MKTETIRLLKMDDKDFQRVVTGLMTQEEYEVKHLIEDQVLVVGVEDEPASPRGIKDICMQKSGCMACDFNPFSGKCSKY